MTTAKRINFEADDDLADSKKPRLDASAQFRKDMSSQEFSKLKKAGKTGKLTQPRPAGFGFTKASRGVVESSEPKVYEKLTKKQRKKLREKRRAHYDTAISMKETWELLRAEKSQAKQKELSAKILNELNDEEKMIQLCKSHDTSRVMSWVFKCAPDDKKNSLFETLLKHFELLVKNKYGKFIALTVVRNCTKEQRNKLMKMLEGKVRTLFVHAYASAVIEELYNNYANESQRIAMQQDIYSRYFVMKSLESQKEQTEASKSSGDSADKVETRKMSLKNLQSLLEQSPELRQSVLKNVNTFILKCVNSKVLKHSFAHKILLEYFFALYENGSNAIGWEKIQEVAPLCREHIVNMGHTPDGSKAILFVLWFTDAKERKAIIRLFKDDMMNLVQHETGYLVACGILDSVDDTKMVNTLLLQTLLKNLEEVMTNNWALKVLIYAMNPRIPFVFNKEVRELLAKGDGNPFTKKDKQTRYREINMYIGEKVAEHLMSKLETNSAIFEQKSYFYLLKAFSGSIYVANYAKEPVYKMILEKSFSEPDFLNGKLTLISLRGLLKPKQEQSDETSNQSNEKPDQSNKSVSKTTEDEENQENDEEIEETGFEEEEDDIELDFAELFISDLLSCENKSFVNWLKDENKSFIISILMKQSEKIRDKLKCLNFKVLKTKKTELKCKDDVLAVLKF